MLSEALTLQEISNEYANQDGANAEALASFYARLGNQSPLLQVLPFVDEGKTTHEYYKTLSIPVAESRQINESKFKHSTVEGQLMTEKLGILGVQAGIDDYTASDVRSSAQMRAFTESIPLALSNGFENAFINGDASNDLNQVFTGIKSRITDPAKTISCSSSDGGGSLALQHLVDLRNLVFQPTHFLMSKTMASKFASVSWNGGVGGYIPQRKENMTYVPAMIDGIPVITFEDSFNENSTVLGFNEADFNGVNLETTSIYLVSLGKQGIYGIKNGAVRVKTVADLQSVRYSAEFYSGIANAGSNSIARVRHISKTAPLITGL